MGVSKDEQQPFKGLPSDTLFHGIGADALSLYGVGLFGLLSGSDREEKNIFNNNSGLGAFNGTELVSVAIMPQPGKPNEAFFTYIEGSPITFAIAGGNEKELSERGYFDERFIDKASGDEIIGIVLDSDTMDKPIAGLEILGTNVHPDKVAEKSRALMKFFGNQFGLEIDKELDELENLLEPLKHIDEHYLKRTMGQYLAADKKVISEVDEFVRSLFARALQLRFQNPNATVLQVVRDVFPTKPVYVNDHGHGITRIPEGSYFEEFVGDDETTGYDRFDNPKSTHRLRSVLKKLNDSP